MTEKTQANQANLMRYGRLVVFMDIPDEQMMADLMGRWREKNTITFICGEKLSVGLIGPAWPDVFYNAYETMSYDELRHMMPWDEVWLVGADEAWSLGPHGEFEVLRATARSHYNHGGWRFGEGDALCA